MFTHGKLGEAPEQGKRFLARDSRWPSAAHHGHDSRRTQRRGDRKAWRSRRRYVQGEGGSRQQEHAEKLHYVYRQEEGDGGAVREHAGRTSGWSSTVDIDWTFRRQRSAPMLFESYRVSYFGPLYYVHRKKKATPTPKKMCVPQYRMQAKFFAVPLCRSPSLAPRFMPSLTLSLWQGAHH